jgi:hypothetical protein
MKRRTATVRTTRGAALLAFSLFSLSECAWGQSNCKQAKGNQVAVAAAGTASGPVTNGGDLNGIGMHVFNSGAFPTSDGTVVSFGGDLTITTNQGQLKASVVYLFDSSNVVTTSQARINPLISTGKICRGHGFSLPQWHDHELQSLYCPTRDHGANLLRR